MSDSTHYLGLVSEVGDSLVPLTYGVSTLSRQCQNCVA